jgi:hypothetical protein
MKKEQVREGYLRYTGKDGDTWRSGFVKYNSLGVFSEKAQ